jgi:deoxyribose-phosphate aldolase
MPEHTPTELMSAPQLARQLLSLIDLTSLGDQDTPAIISALCQKAIVPAGHVAAVCIYPQFVATAVTELSGTPVKIASVANFPRGASPVQEVETSIALAIENGAQEIDVVFPYQQYLAGDTEAAAEFIHRCKTRCRHALLKVILETGAFGDAEQLTAAAIAAVAGGADFLKTSTGKIAIGATLPAATVLLSVIKDQAPRVGRPLGFKASGGVRTIAQAASYVALAQQILGQDWVKPANFRLGASQLMDVLTSTL